MVDIRIPDFQQSQAIVDKEGKPVGVFLRYLNSAFQSLVNNANATNAALAAAGIAQAAAVAANTAATGAQTAANTAQTAANTAQDAADATIEATALANSWVTGLTVTATDAGANATITISAHTRNYAYDPVTTKAVNGGSLTALAYDTTYYIYYDQASRLGGAVTYVVTTVATNVAQVNNRHSVATVRTPLAAGAPKAGFGVVPPGGNYVEP